MVYTSIPGSNSNNIAVTSNIELDFDTDINLSSVHSNSTNADDVFDDNIKIVGSQNGQYRGIFSMGADNSIVIFNPSISFKAGERITVVVNSLVLGTGGEVAIAKSFSFIAASGPFEGAFLERPTAGIIGVVYGNADWGDYDGDGDLDVAVVGFDPGYNQIAVIYNNVNGVFTDIGAVLTGVSDGACEWGDYDGDGDLDLLIAGLDASFTNRIAKIYRNDGGTAFTDIGAGLTGVDFASVDWGDYDNDGDLDLVIAGRHLFSPDFHSTIIYQNNGGVFTDIGASLTGVTDGSVDWGDYDGDGDLDLLITGFDETLARHFTIYRNDGGSFVDIGASLPGFGFSSADWGDYDNDGDLDIAVMGGKSVGTDGAFIYQNNAGSFVDIGAGLPDAIEEGSIRWGDYDGDGDLDLLLTGQDYSPGDNITSAIFRNDAGVFTNINAGLDGVTFQSVGDWIDFDGDGDLDLFVAGENIPGDIVSKLYENTIFNAFVTTWKTDNPGTSNDNQITIPTTGTGYFYNVNWGDGNSDTDVTGSITHTYATPGTYTVSITGAFPRIFFNATSIFTPKESRKILTVEQWGNVAWSSMASAFTGCANLRINATDAPNLSGVTDMSRMFMRAAAMNDNIDNWNVGTVTNMSELFADATAFNQPLNNWNVGSVTDMRQMFWFASAFNQDIGGWTVSNVTNMGAMFAGATSFNQNIGGWNVIKVTSLSSTFSFASVFNQDISGWTVDNVTDMSGLFNNAIAFNQDISGWNINNVTTMANMFKGAIAFTNDITGWNVTNVKSMSGMLSDLPTFNQDISGWTVTNVLDMSSMFENTPMFNQDISGWSVGNVTDMNSMFAKANGFNQDISGWNVGNVTDMRVMFSNASSFNQDLSGWDVSKLSQAFNMLNNSGLSVSNYDNLLEGWASQTVKPNVQLGASGLYYCSGATARGILTGTYNWFITDEGAGCISAFNGSDITAPEILNGQVIAIDFGSIDILPSTKVRSLTIENKQSITLNNVVIAITGTTFTTPAAPFILAPGATHTFAVTLSNASAGTFNETLSITSDNFPGVFSFPLTGKVTAAPEPEIVVYRGLLAAGDVLNNGEGLYVGSEFRGNNVTNQVTIFNNGAADLNIAGINITGTTFSLLSPPPTLISPNNSVTIDIILDGTIAGNFIETLTIVNDDTDESNFDFELAGDIYGPEISVFDGLDRYSDPEVFNGQLTAINLGSGAQGADITRTLTIANFGPVDMVVSNISITGTVFSTTFSPPQFIAAEVDGVVSSITFGLILSGVTAGTFNETVTITSDDDTDPVFQFPITGIIAGGVCVNPPTASIGSISDMCENNPIALSGIIGGAATTSTWTTNGDGVFSDAASITSTYTAGNTDITNGIVTLTLTTNDPDGTGACVSASATVMVNINKAATVSAGFDLTICPTDVVSLTGIPGGSANNLLWTTSGTGTFGDNTAAVTTYTPDASDISMGSVVLTLSADAVGVCPQVSDLLVVTINQPLIAANLLQNVNVQQPIVADVITNSTINANDVITVSIVQNGLKGTASVNADKTISYLASAGTVGADSFQYRICNQCNLCSDGVVTVDIINSPPVISQPSIPINAVVGQVISIPFGSLISDLNDNIDPTTIQIVQGPTSNAIATFDNSFNLSLDYSTVSFVGTDEITIRVCDLLNECTQITIQIKVDGEIVAYNGLSPNGDGKNDFFLLENIQFLGPDNKVKIFNRWGDKVFEIDNYNNVSIKFEGKQNNGTELPSGVYFYKVNYDKIITQPGTSSVGEMTGYLTIKR